MTTKPVKIAARLMFNSAVSLTDLKIIAQKRNAKNLSTISAREKVEATAANRNLNLKKSLHFFDFYVIKYIFLGNNKF